MSAPNFKTQDNFSLYARGNLTCKVCPECGCAMGDGDDACMECGASLKGVEVTYDEIGEDMNCEAVVRDMKRANTEFDFHKITLESGYYTGVQFFVEEKFNGYDKIEEMDNEDCQCYYGECRSKVLRRYNTEVRKVQKAMAKIAANHGFSEFICVARFSNGEAMYQKVDPKKGPTVHQAAKAAMVA